MYAASLDRLNASMIKQNIAIAKSLKRMTNIRYTTYHSSYWVEIHSIRLFNARYLQYKKQTKKLHFPLSRSKNIRDPSK